MESRLPPRMSATAPAPRLHGLVAEFEDPDNLLAAAHKAHEAGYRRMDAYSPFPIEELSEAIGFHHTRLPAVVLLAGLTGMVCGFLLQYIALGLDYPLNIDGRALFSWQSFVPITFEGAILFASIGAVLSWILMNGLPRPYHPIFNAPNFERATQDRFFLCIEARDPKFNRQGTQQFLESLGPTIVSEVAD
ncbi:MAG TPA: DUF3341 domain-containing protein [Roseiflexaceae bacterium]|nr:DUF3341 domain-containing protein [Roseiflexaceae bacterium]